jgi:molybdopterin synthase sulfur carrier subunit
MQVRLRFFASLRERLGEGETVEVPEGSTVAAVRDLLLARGGAHAEVLARSRAVRAALNQKLCAESTTPADGDELAFFPPVTGG